MIYPIASKCNQRCIFCSADGRSDEFEIEQFKKAVLNSKDKLFVLSGGDPFCLDVSRLIYIIKIAADSNKQIEIQTNASKIVEISEEHVKLIVSLVNRTNGYFNINLPAHKSTLDYKITFLRNGFKKRMKSISILKKFGAIIRITHVINTFNYKDLPHFAKFLISNSKLWNWVQFSFVKAMGRAFNSKYVVPQYKDVKDYLLEAMEILEKNNFEFWVDHIPLCFLGKFYNRSVDFFKITHGVKGEYLYEKKKLEKCSGCKFYNVCPGPRIDYIKIYGGI